MLTPTLQLIPPLAAMNPALIIFDKDGTLLDFNAMWGAWAQGLARRLETATGLSVAQPLFEALAFDPVSGVVIPSGPLSIAPAAVLRQLVTTVLQQAGLPPSRAKAVMSQSWYTPDPVALAQPLTDLAGLFGVLRSHGLKIAVATSDDRAPTRATLAGLGLDGLVDALACADDGIPIKPAPDMILKICRQLNIAPAKAVMVGDNPDDLQMGRAAGAGLTIGVCSGVGSAAQLTPVADVVLPSVAALLNLTRPETTGN